MARYRRADTRWIRAACIAGAYLVGVAILFMLQVGEAIVVPVPFAISAPPLVYAALSVVMLRQAPFFRRLSWVGGACLIHVLLGALASLELMSAGGLRVTSALAQVFFLYAPAPVLTLLATPLLLALCGVQAPRPASPAESPTPRQPRTPPVARPTSFARAGRVGDGAAEPARGASPAAPVGRSSPPAAKPVPTPPAVRASAPVPTAASAPAVTATPPPSMMPKLVPLATPAPRGTLPPPPLVTPPPAPSVAPSPVRETRPAEARKPARQNSISHADDVMVRVSFDRIASQLPAEAFVLPFDRLGESLREPHKLLVPRRVVLAQMREGGIAIDWSTVASQFPDLALGLSEAEFRNRYPELKLSLPVDEVLPQLPSDTVPLVSAVLNTEGLEAVPPPIAPPVVAAPTEAPIVPPVFTAPPVTVAPPAVEAAPAVGVRPAPAVDREAVARIVACFSGVGTFEAAGECVAGTPLVSLVAPSLSREAVTACAAGVVRFLTTAGEVVTVRTTRGVLVLAAAPTPIVVAARRPGAPIALLELRAARAAVAVGDGRLTVSPTPSRPLESLTVDDRVAGAAQALTSFGSVEPTVFAAGGARVYVFSAGGRDAVTVGGLALGVCEALRSATSELGPLVSVVFRCGSELTLVRPLGSGAAVLAATGKVTRPGRVHRDADRAAAVLEAL